MKVRDLIEALEDCNGDDEVLIATQPSWPLQFTTATVLDGSEVTDECGTCGGALDNHAPDCDAVDEDGSAVAAGTVYITAGNHPDSSPYAPRAVFDDAA